MDIKNAEKNADYLLCSYCDFKCSKKSNFDKHLLTTKHISQSQGYKKDIKKCRKMPKLIEEHNRCHCGKTYIYPSGLWRHKKVCKFNHHESENINLLQTTENEELKNIILDVVKSNNELHKTLIEVCQKIQPTTNVHNTSNTNNTNNINNKTFNLNFFLNEQCKDAMNIMDFVNSMTLQLSDLESVEKLGYVEGISNIMVRKLNEMDIYKRPVHCSDIKRDIMYVKDKDKWEKDSVDHVLLHKAIKYISKKNSDLLVAWSNKYPASKNSSSHVNEQYMRMIKQSMGGNGEIEDNENKIIKKISKMFVIDRNS